MDQWTGEEALLLRRAMRASVREFAERLGIGARTVTYWTQNPGTVCRPETAQILDAALARCAAEDQERFRVLLAALRGDSAALAADESARPGACTVVSHKFMPVYLGEHGTALFAAGAERAAGPGGLERRTLSADHRSARSSVVVAYACGVAVVHLEEHRRVETLTELAVWRYRTYAADPAWAGECIAQLLKEHATPDRRSADVTPQYVLSAYELRDAPWGGASLDTALHLLTTPSVLVNRQDPKNVVPLGPGSEDAKFREAWTHPGAVVFGGGVSRGVAGWSGVAYHPQADERALTMSQIVDLELDAQALWALSSHVLHMVESGEDPVMPPEFGWRFLRGAHVRLTTARPTETAQHRVMREAILATSELPDRLRAAQDALRDGAM
ncbi:XRE family transcriptional regulator [Streptodolium elevatio]|uniref:XRE family transcriptional regulator n=1 Tax=Streptodolium elevatio TaxID=3157996 RepID=A0ABV3DL60_9ACTN